MHVFAPLFPLFSASLGHWNTEPWTFVLSQHSHSGESRSMSGIYRLHCIPPQVLASSAPQAQPKLGTWLGVLTFCTKKSYFGCSSLALQTFISSASFACGEKEGMCFKVTEDGLLLPRSVVNPPAAINIKGLALKSHQFLSNSPGLIFPWSTDIGSGLYQLHKILCLCYLQGETEAQTCNYLPKFSPPRAESRAGTNLRLL